MAVELCFFLLIRVLICMFSHQFMGSWMPSTDNEIFAHYIFMDNKFTLPTAAGLPMTFALSGTFAPGAKGGLHISPTMVRVLIFPKYGILAFNWSKTNSLTIGFNLFCVHGVVLLTE